MNDRSKPFDPAAAFAMGRGLVINPAASAQRLEAEARGMADMLARATPPTDTGPVPVAPARGALRVAVEMGMTPHGATDWAATPTGHRGRRTVHRADAFDRMALAAEKAGKPAPFTAGQVAAGRHWRDLVERYRAAGMRSMDLNRSGGGSGGGGFMDAVCDQGAELRRLRARIGQGTALAVRRIRPSARGDGARHNITDLVLIGHVCLDDLSLHEVLARYGWSPRSPANLAAVHTALADTLERIR